METAKRFLVISLLITITLMINLQAAINYQVVPLPHVIQFLDKTPYKLTSGVTVYYQETSEAMKRNAYFLSNYLQDVFGKKAIIKAGKAKKGITLVLDNKIENPEGYTITVDAKGITIAGGTEAGVFYGIQTLRKAIPLRINGTVIMPAVKICDEPRFAYRGIMLDASRHFETIENIRKFIDMLALHHVNRFHWHLTDDQGWRMEIKKYPRLTEIGSKRKETVIGRNSGKYDSIPHEGFYTQY